MRLIKKYLPLAIAALILHKIYSSLKSTPMIRSPQQVIVVGSGLAGLSSAVTALQHGLKVTVLEMEPKFGGNSIKASSGINGAPTRFQHDYKANPDTEFMKDTIMSSGQIFESSTGIDKLRRIELMETLTANSASAIKWLTDTLQIDLSVVAQLGGHSRARTHRGGGKSGPPGFSIISTMLRYIEKNYPDSAVLNNNCKVTKLLTDPSDSNSVIGLQYEDNNKDGELNTVYGPVIMATGGFAGDLTGSLIAEYRPDLLDYPTTNTPRESSLHLLLSIGAQLMDMESIQVHPTGFVLNGDGNEFEKVKFLAAEALRGEGGILVNGQGDRFVNELNKRNEVTAAIKDNCEMAIGENGVKQWGSWIVMDEGSASKLQSNVDFYCFKKLMHKKKLGDLLQQFPNLKGTLISYSSSVENGVDNLMGRKAFGGWSLNSNEIDLDTVIYVGQVTPVLHFTMGGVQFNANAEILNKFGKPINGIYGCGEVTAGVHSSNRLAGSSLLECVVFGRIAGEQVAELGVKSQS